MAARLVTHTEKDKDGDIIALCNPFSEWLRREKDDAINDIETKKHSYFVLSNGTIVDIIVVDDPNGKYLRTDPDETTENNLGDLPDC